MEREHDNLRAALTWSQTIAADIEAGPRMAGALWTFWYTRGHLREGRAQVERILTEPATPPIRARITGAAGVLAFYQGDPDAALAYLEEARSLWQSLDDERGVAWTLHRLGMVARQRGEVERAVELCAESIALWRRLGDRTGLALALHPAALIVQSRGDFETSLAFSEEAVTWNRAVGNRAELAWSLSILGTAAFSLGDLARARAVLDDAHARFRALGDEHGLANVRSSQIAVARREGDAARAAPLLYEVLSLQRKHGSVRSYPRLLDDLAWLAHVRARPVQSARLVGAADIVRLQTGRPVDPVYRDDRDRLIADLRTTLGEQSFEAAFAEGQAMSLDEAVAYALDEPAPA